MQTGEHFDVYDVKLIKGFIRRRMNIFIQVSFLIIVASIITAYAIPRSYQSTATILIEGQMSEDLVKGVSAGYVEERLQAIKQQVLSRDKLLAIKNKFNLYPELDSQADIERAVEKIRDDIQIRTIKVEDLDQRPSVARYSTVAFTLSFEGKDPVVVQEVASQLASTFVEKNVQRKDQIATQTTVVLERKLNQLKEQTEILQRKLSDFKRAHAGELPESIPFNLGETYRLNTQLDEVNAKIKILEDRKANVSGSTASSGTQASAAGEQTATDPWSRLAQLRLQLVNLQSRYSEKHPDVRKTKNEIQQLEVRLGVSNELSEKSAKLEELRGREAELKKARDPEHPEVAALSKEIELLSKDVQRLKQQRIPGDPTEVELKRHYRQREEIQRKIAEFSRRTQLAPVTQSEYSKLLTEHESVMRQYNETMSKLNEAKLAKGMEETQLGERFTIIDEPQVPVKHHKPKRSRIMLAGFLLSLLGGAFTAVVMERLDHSIKSVEQLQKIAKMHVLSVIPLIPEEEEKPLTRKEKILKTLADPGGTVLGLVSDVMKKKNEKKAA